MKKSLFPFVFILLFIQNNIVAQKTWQEIIETPMPDLPISCCLYQIGKYCESDPDAAIEKAAEMGLIFREGKQILVEVISGDDFDKKIDTIYLHSLGLSIKNLWKNRANVWIKINQLITLSQSVNDDYFVSAVFRPIQSNQGPNLVHSESYPLNGAGGNGKHVGIFDSGFAGLQTALNMGVGPTLTGYDYTGAGIESGNPNSSDNHGVRCLETIFDHAPNASYSIYKIFDSTDFGEAIDDAIDNNVNIISHSLGWFNTGWADNSGPICNAVQDASDAGILFITSAGNENNNHWQGAWSDANQDSWHNWSESDQRNDVVIPPNGSVRVFLSWATSDNLNAYDLYLYNNSTNQVLSSSTNSSDFESISWTNTTGTVIMAGISIRDGPIAQTPEFEIYANVSDYSTIEYISGFGATASPTNSTASFCISVGAVSRFNYSGGIIESYSSKGPTNSGNNAPDICAPTGTTTFTGGDSDFYGTSCSAPNAAGAIAAFWSAHPNMSALEVKVIIFRMAELYNDWGDSGRDNVFGYGGIQLYDFVSNTIFIYNFTGGAQPCILPDLYANPQCADAWAPEQRHAVILTQNFSVPTSGLILNKKMTYTSLTNSSKIE